MVSLDFFFYEFLMGKRLPKHPKEKGHRSFQLKGKKMLPFSYFLCWKAVGNEAAFGISLTGSPLLKQFAQ